MVWACGTRAALNIIAAEKKERQMRLASIVLVVLMGSATAHAQENKAHEKA